MRYAIISDIHGNYPALSAVLADAAKSNVDQYIFVGDYAIGLPYPNETVTVISKIKNSRTVYGNGESYLMKLSSMRNISSNDGQFGSVYWADQTLTQENKLFLLNLPKNISFTEYNTHIHITHASDDIIGNIERKEFSPSKIVLKYADRVPTHEILLKDINHYLTNSAEFRSILNTLSDGIYIFGHTHIQWFARFENKIFINPGSCGEPLDFSVDNVPYTILELNGNDISIDERHVPFDRSALIKSFKNSLLYKQASVTSDFTIQQLITGREHLIFFLEYAEKYAQQNGDHDRPFSLVTWENAYKSWKENKPNCCPIH